jgi:hypothetical protein
MHPAFHAAIAEAEAVAREQVADALARQIGAAAHADVSFATAATTRRRRLLG